MIGQSITAPLSGGLSCLAAIPPQAWHIVPEPYSWLVHPSRQDNFEDLYNSCFDSDTSAFDIEGFSKKCHVELAKIGITQDANAGSSSKSGGVPGTKSRKLSAGDNFWTVLKYSRTPLDQPFEPPDPFAERIPRLRRNAKIRATKIPVKAQIERINKDQLDFTRARNINERESSAEGNSDELQISVHDIPYKQAFKSSRS